MMRTIANHRSLAGVLFTACLLFLAPARADSDDTTKDAARIDTLLHQAGYESDRRSDVVWTVARSGRSLGDFKVIVTTGNGLLVVFVIVAHKADMKMSEALAYKMLNLNHEFDRVKVGIDDDGDAFVRSDVSMRVLDEVELKEQIEQVAAAADESYGDIKPFLKK